MRGEIEKEKEREREITFLLLEKTFSRPRRYSVNISTTQVTKVGSRMPVGKGGRIDLTYLR